MISREVLGRSRKSGLQAAASSFFDCYTHTQSVPADESEGTWAGKVLLICCLLRRKERHLMGVSLTNH